MENNSVAFAFIKIESTKRRKMKKKQKLLFWWWHFLRMIKFQFPMIDKRFTSCGKCIVMYLVPIPAPKCVFVILKQKLKL